MTIHAGKPERPVRYQAAYDGSCGEWRVWDKDERTFLEETYGSGREGAYKATQAAQELNDAD